MTTLEDIAQRLDRLERLAQMSVKNIVTINEAAMLTGYSVKYLRLLISRHEIPYYRRGNRLFFDRGEVEGWMTCNRIPSSQEIAVKASGYRSRTNKQK